jgi:hypothetical protein
VPETGWLTKVAVDGEASQLGYDLAVDASGAGRPSAVDAGLALPAAPAPPSSFDLGRLLLTLAFVGVGITGIAFIGSSRPGGRPLAS